MLEFWNDPNTRLWLIGAALILLSLVIRWLRQVWAKPPAAAITGLGWAVVALVAAADVARTGSWNWTTWLLDTMAAIGTLTAGYEGILKHIYGAIEARRAAKAD